MNDFELKASELILDCEKMYILFVLFFVFVSSRRSNI